MHRAVYCLFLAALLVGCATPAVRQFQAMRAHAQRDAAELKACTNVVYNSPQYAPLRSHLPLDANDISLEQLSNETYASPAEIQAIFSTYPQMQACRKTFLSGVTKGEPSLVPIFIADYYKLDDNILLLVQRKITWGDYLHRIRDLAANTRAALQSEDHRVVAELRRENDAEIAQRQRAAEAFAAWAQTQEMINAASRPVITNCSGFGNIVNCVSR